MSIPKIGVDGIGIRRLDIPDITNSLTTPAPSFFTQSPVTTHIGFPIVDIPGCVEARNAQNNRNLPEDDPKGNLVLCDGNVPSYNPLNFEPEQHLRTPVQGVDTRIKQPKPPEIKTPEIPEIPIPPAGEEKKVEEVPAPEPEIPWVEKYLPTPEAATTTAGIAVVATTSALLAKPLADILLRVIKPVTKKIITKIATIRGKTPPILSLKERRAEQRLRNHAIRVLREVFPRKKKG